mgnify:CR=1 FL=1|jgi:hypothetical protein
MRTYTRNTRTSKDLRTAIENCLDFHGKYRNSYFWSSRGNAAQRRRDEERFETQNPSFDIVTPAGTIRVRPSLDISCKNVYYSLEITLDGEKKNIGVLKGLI